MQLEPGLESMKFVRKAKAKPITVDELKKFEGVYEFAPGAEAKFYIKAEKLYAFVAGQPEYELVNVDTNKFALKALDGYAAKFDVDEKGNITAVIFMQPNGNFKATRKK